MDKEMTLRHLAEAEGHKALGERHIAEQRTRIERLERDGHDVSEAKAFLATLEATQLLHEEHLARLKKELWEDP